MSRPTLPRLSLMLLTVALLAGVCGATYVLRFNPEMDFWRQAAKRKLAWADQMRRTHGNVIGAVGGSTTTFGIDAGLLERDDALPVANLGLHAGMGPDVCVGFGFAALQRGDILILSLEPSMLTEELHTTPLGSRLAWMLGKPELLAWDSPPSWLTWLCLLTQLQPGGYHVVTMLGKLALQEELYRYNIEEARPGGLQVTKERRPFIASMNIAAGPGQGTLSKSGRAMLECSGVTRWIQSELSRGVSTGTGITSRRRRRSARAISRMISAYVRTSRPPTSSVRPVVAGVSRAAMR